MIVEVHYNLTEWQQILQHHSLLIQIDHLLLSATPFLYDNQHMYYTLIPNLLWYNEINLY